LLSPKIFLPPKSAVVISHHMAKDPNEFARGILDTIIAKHDPKSVKGRDAKKVASGLMGGSKGGHARAKNLSAKRRKAIAKKAVETRWGKKTSKK
jgi:hypothetical protein